MKQLNALLIVGQFIINSNFVTKKRNRFKLSFQPKIQLKHKTQVARPALT